MGNRLALDTLVYFVRLAGLLRFGIVRFGVERYLQSPLYKGMGDDANRENGMVGKP